MSNPREKERILILSHGHPDFSKGGAEIAAYNLYQAFSKRDDCEVLFLGRHGYRSLSHTGTPFGRGNTETELLAHSHTEFFTFSQAEPRSMCEGFRGLLQRFKPTVVHFHHYIDLGLELIREVRNYSDKVPIVLTLHEYLAICNHYGQMLKKDHQLCWKASPAECHFCVPDKTPADYRLRELFIKSFFSIVDLFIAPSQFLLDRYVEWGLPRDRFLLQENGQVADTKLAPRSLDAETTRGRFAYFGQINAFKGVDLLLEAIAILPKKINKKISVAIHGSGLNNQPPEFKQFQDRLHGYLESEKKTVKYYGRYESHELKSLMAEIDWVVVPSIWWENSPLVIQEAFKFGRPVICADIGGMAEKVTHGVNGLHFRARNPVALADCLQQAATVDGLWDQLYRNIQPPLSVADQAARLMSVYAGLIASRSKKPLKARRGPGLQS